MEINPAKIKKLAKEKADENWEFRIFLKQINMRSEEVDAVVHRIYQEIASKIDCKSCANCCKELLPLVDEEDIETMSQLLGYSVDHFKEQYIVEDEEEGGYTFNKRPCPFLEDICVCGDFRPKECKSFPHLHKEGFVFRLISVVQNCSVCPIVFHTYEQLKGELWHYHFDDYLEDSDVYMEYEEGG